MPPQRLFRGNDIYAVDELFCTRLFFGPGVSAIACHDEIAVITGSDAKISGCKIKRTDRALDRNDRLTKAGSVSGISIKRQSYTDTGKLLWKVQL